jgi:hypothetical protein
MGVGVNGCIAIAPTPLPSRLLTTSAEGLLGKRQRLPASVRCFMRDDFLRSSSRLGIVQDLQALSLGMMLLGGIEPPLTGLQNPLQGQAEMVGWHVHNNRPIETALFL